MSVICLYTEREREAERERERERRRDRETERQRDRERERERKLRFPPKHRSASRAVGSARKAHVGGTEQSPKVPPFLDQQHVVQSCFVRWLRDLGGSGTAEL